MNIYVTKNEQQHGPYTPAEVLARLTSGQFVTSDLGWHAGAAGWLPLSQLLTAFGPEGEPPFPQKSSALAKISFIIAMVGIGGWLVLLVMAAAGVSRGARDNSPLMMFLGLFMFAGMAANLTGSIFGLIALAKPSSNKWMAITGAIANAAELLGVLFLMVLGMAQK
jgi:hypothetical protein